MHRRVVRPSGWSNEPAAPRHPPTARVFLTRTACPSPPLQDHGTGSGVYERCGPGAAANQGEGRLVCVRVGTGRGRSSYDSKLVRVAPLACAPAVASRTATVSNLTNTTTPQPPAQPEPKPYTKPQAQQQQTKMGTVSQVSVPTPAAATHRRAKPCEAVRVLERPSSYHHSHSCPLCDPLTHPSTLLRRPGTRRATNRSSHRQALRALRRSAGMVGLWLP